MLHQYKRLAHFCDECDCEVDILQEYCPDHPDASLSTMFVPIDEEPLDTPSA